MPSTLRGLPGLDLAPWGLLSPQPPSHSASLCGSGLGKAGLGGSAMLCYTQAWRTHPSLALSLFPSLSQPNKMNHSSQHSTHMCLTQNWVGSRGSVLCRRRRGSPGRMLWPKRGRERVPDEDLSNHTHISVCCEYAEHISFSLLFSRIILKAAGGCRMPTFHAPTSSPPSSKSQSSWKQCVRDTGGGTWARESRRPSSLPLHPHGLQQVT